MGGGGGGGGRRWEEEGGILRCGDSTPSTPALSSNDDEVTYTKREFAAIVVTPIGVLLLVIIAMCFFCPVYSTDGWKIGKGDVAHSIQVFSACLEHCKEVTTTK